MAAVSAAAAETTTLAAETSTLARLSEVGAGNLPDPEKVLRKKAAALAMDEHARMAEAFRTAGCIEVRDDVVGQEGE